LLLAVAVSGGLVGYAGSAVRDPVYSASATILLQDPSVDGDNAAGLRADEAELWITSRAQLATSSRTLDRAAKALGGGTTADELRQDVTTEALVDRFTLTVSARAADPAVAAERANAIVVAYREMESEDAADAAAEAENQYQERLEGISASIDDASATLASKPTDRLAATLLTANVEERLRLESAAAERIADARRRASSVRDVTMATASSKPSNPLPWQDAAITALVALLLASAVVLFRGRERRYELSRPEQVTEILGAPLLVELSRGELNRDEPSPATSAALGFIAAKLRVMVGHRGGVIVIAGTAERPTAGVVASQLASQARRSTWSQVALLRSNGAGDQLDQAETMPARVRLTNELVVIEGPPLRRRGDFATTVMGADGMIVVFEEGDPLEHVRSATDILTMLQIPLVGHVFVRSTSGSLGGMEEPGLP